MERNDSNDTLGGNGQGDANEFSGSKSTQQDSSFDFTGSAGSTDGIRERAKHAVGTASEKLSEVGSSVRERAGTAKDKLASALESGADRLRSQGGGATLVGATPNGGASLQADGRIAQVSDKVAGGMQASAEWLREADLDGLKTGIERQVKDHPGRTLLIAAGLGYLVARAFRGEK